MTDAQVPTAIGGARHADAINTTRTTRPQVTVQSQGVQTGDTPAGTLGTGGNMTCVL
jgi:hypothetical protein